MNNVNYHRYLKDNQNTHIKNSEFNFKWWMIISLLIYIISLSVIMSNDYNKDGHFMMSDSLYTAFTEPELGEAIIHWIMFVIGAIFLGIIATCIPPWLGLIIVPGPLYCIYTIGNFILLCFSKVIWGVLNIVFLILFGWVESVFY